MTRFLAAAALLGALSSAASAQTWSGSYAGLGLGYQSGTTRALFYNPPGTVAGNDSHSLSGATLRGVLGYNSQSGSMVWGAELGAVAGRVDGNDAFNSGFLNATRMGTQVYVAGRAGVASGNALFYGSLGWAFQSARLTEVQLPGGPITEAHSVWHTGPRLAVGAEMLLGSGALRFEVDHVRYNRRTARFAGYDIDSRPHLTGASVSYLFRF